MPECTQCRKFQLRQYSRSLGGFILRDSDLYDDHPKHHLALHFNIVLARKTSMAWDAVSKSTLVSTQQPVMIQLPSLENATKQTKRR